MTDDPAITARGLRKSYGRSRVLDHLDLTVEAGAAIGLLGANGAGKTTLLKALLGLIPVDAGRATMLGHSSYSLPPPVRQRLAYVPQTPTQFPWLTGRAMLNYLSRFYSSFDWDCVRDLSARWKLALRTPIGTLSPGQQQRLSIVRALATRPEVLVLDEPIASLDPATRIAVIDELLAERARRSMTLIFSSHLIGDLERLCTRFAVLANGRIAVLEDIQWFRGLVRARLEADESLLADISVPSAAITRKSGDGRRTVLLDRSIADRLRTILPAAVNVIIDQPDLESAASEWMA